VDAIVLFVFLFFDVGLFYNLPVLAAGIQDVRRRPRILKTRSSFESGIGGLPFISLLVP
jgi:hypothetical protein